MKRPAPCRGVTAAGLLLAVPLPAEATPAEAAERFSREAGGSGVEVRGRARAASAGEVTREREVLAAAPHRTASDLLLTVPGVYVTQHSGEGKAHQIFFRGFDAVHGQDLELVVGGLPVNQPGHLHGQGYADLHFVAPEAVRRVRAEPGPFEGAQGDFAVAGTVSFELGWPEPGTWIAASSGRYGTRRVLLGFRPERASEETFGVFEAEATDGFGPGRRAERAGALAQVSQPLSGALRARFLSGVHAGRFGSAGVLREEDVAQGRIDRFGSYDTDQGGRSSLAFALAELGSQLDDRRWFVRPWIGAWSLDLRQNYTGYLVDPVRGDRQQQLDQRLALGLAAGHLQPLRLFSSRDSLETGFSARHDAIEQSQARRSAIDDTVTAREVDAEVSFAEVGGWVMARLRPAPRLLVRAGARVTGISVAVVDRAPAGLAASRSAQGLHLGEKAGADLAIAPGLRLLGAYGAGFRSPQPRSLGDGERAPFTRVRSGEIGLRWEPDHRLRASVAGFTTWLSDDLVFDETTARNERTPATRRVGAAVDLVATPAPWLHSAVGATVVRATFLEGDAGRRAGSRVPFVPGVVTRADLSAQRRLARFARRELVGRVGWGISSVHDRPLPYSELGRDVTLVSARTAARLDEVELSLDVENLFDTEHWDGEFQFASNHQRGATPSLVPARHVTAGRPRTWLVTLALHL